MNKGSTAKVIDIIDMASYDAGYAAGYSEGENCGYDVGYEKCRADYRQRVRERKKTKYAAKRRRLYFLKQKIIGVFFLIGTILMVRLLDGDATIALLTVPISLTLIFSKEKYWMDQYYFDTEEERS